MFAWSADEIIDALLDVSQVPSLERFSATRNLENVLDMWQQTLELGIR